MPPPCILVGVTSKPFKNWRPLTPVIFEPHGPSSHFKRCEERQWLAILWGVRKSARRRRPRPPAGPMLEVGGASPIPREPPSRQEHHRSRPRATWSKPKPAKSRPRGNMSLGRSERHPNATSCQTVFPSHFARYDFLRIHFIPCAGCMGTFLSKIFVKVSRISLDSFT